MDGGVEQNPAGDTPEDAADGSARSVWRRVLRSRVDIDPPVTPARALRVALTRSAERGAGLSVTALGVSDDQIPLADLLARLEDGWLFMRIDGGTGGPGLLAVDFGFLAAAAEMQMRGVLSEQQPERRRLTAADAALGHPVLLSFLDELERTATGTALEGWAQGRYVSDRIADLRSIGLILGEGDYRTVALSSWLGAGERQGHLIMALPVQAAKETGTGPLARSEQWEQAIQTTVLAAPTPVEAILARLRLTLRNVQGLHVGQQLVLPGVRVTSVRIETQGGRVIGRGRLGQAGGMRAVRIEPEPMPELSDDRGLLTHAQGRPGPLSEEGIIG